MNQVISRLCKNKLILKIIILNINKCTIFCWIDTVFIFINTVQKCAFTILLNSL